MLKPGSIVQIMLFLILFSSCKGKHEQYVLEITNKLDRPRNNEMVEIRKSELEGMVCDVFSRLGVKDLKTGKFLPSQVIDADMNGEFDILIFQPALEAVETREYHLVPLEEPADYSDHKTRTFSRFVPERTGDYAWENDRVAFRTYGPTAEKMVEQGLKRSERLRQSILEKAFEGKLVPQDPTDEPAEKLLERIRAEKAAREDGKKATGGSRNRLNMTQRRLM